ncbi:uncharacterized protein LAESUDRAFT_48935 [Laetiporus sulphureus 93-53]|uniref:Vacuolar membrane-associated protein IML1 n=1 Tax=Laetiporus sulphureus 93-53 TaxID=1314785 RepID=A0A165FAI9_9APHY|nr:uncharacterized protein LAESUDRAFT_48935 [Laetiporus sulphureus 93-53]KZT08675.1 hypothetical protein LAESUDRAFT_48935 [Laetiporus sulphureus 93-53]
MSSSRAESQASQFGRRRSNTVTSQYKPPSVSATPLRLGDSKTLTTWVHDPKDSPNVQLNHSWWPGVAEGDVIRVSTSAIGSSSGFLFSVQKDEGNMKPQLQVSVPRPVADQFGLRNNGEVTLTKIDKSKYSAEYIELTFQDQYLGRNEMWRLSSHLVGQCTYVEQEISFIGVIAAKIQAIYIGGKKVPSAYITSSTKAIYRSLSAKVTIFIQVCRELWEFAGDGERYNEKIVHSFLPTLFNKWREAGTNHIVTIVLISRVFYDPSEVDYAAGPLRQDEDGRWYKDFYKVVTDLEVLYDWKPTLVGLKNSFWAFQQDILLTHHYHRPTVNSREPGHARLVGQLSYAHDGPLLEALNLGLNPTETHYIDRSLSLTGSLTVVITPGTGYYRISKRLLRLTTTRLLDQGFGVELVCLTKPPLHQSPIFSFQGVEPDVRMGAAGLIGSRALDPLWGGDEELQAAGRQKTLFWWEPFWMATSFWDKQMDHPFRTDRFVARAKMHEIEMLGLLDNDVLSNIEIPFLPPPMSSSTYSDASGSACISKEDADAFDSEIFAPIPETQHIPPNRGSIASSGSGSGIAALLRHDSSLKRTSSGRNSEASIWSLHDLQEEAAQPVQMPADLSASDAEQKVLLAASAGLSSSPSQASILSNRSGHSLKSVRSTASSSKRRSKQKPSAATSSTRSPFMPSWLFNPFKSGPSQPQTTPVSGTSTRGASISPRSEAQPPRSVMAASTPTAVRTPQVRSPQVTIRTISSRRDADEETVVSHPAVSQIRSPISTSPRDSLVMPRRRMIDKTTSSAMSVGPSYHAVQTNPCKPSSRVSYMQWSLARRWQHMFPEPFSKHEIKWKAMKTPGCLPLTIEYFPPMSELEAAYDMTFYDFVVDPPEMRSFLVRPPSVSGTADEVRGAWALAVMRGMVASRLAQGFQFVSRPSRPAPHEMDVPEVLRRTRSYVAEDDATPKPTGVSDVLKSPHDPIYLSMSNEIHRIAYRGDSIQVRRYVRRMPQVQPFQYQCLIWPKLGVGYTELSTSFISHGLEGYGWNRLDMLVAGYETQFNESIRYWRTRFVVIPTDEPPSTNVGPAGEKLNDEEVRLLGMDKLAELFSKARWCPPEEKGRPTPPVRFITTDMEPVACILDESLIAQLDEIHAKGPLRKKTKSERDIADMSLAAIAKAMREEEGVPIKEHRWHGRKYPNSFLGSDFVSWLVREFRDISSREQGVDVGNKLQERGLFEHCRGAHGFLDGHYFYALKGEYLVPMTPRGGWFRSSRQAPGDDSGPRTGFYPGSGGSSIKKTKKRLIMSQSMVIDIDPNKRSDQAESVILHHDIIHNPATCFHFELQWLGTTARCIDDLLRQWSRTIERYGLKLVEAYVTQICDIRDRNPFQSCFPISIALPPPIVPDLDKRVADGVQAKFYFEYAMLRKHGFVLDIEAAALYPEQVDVVYSYRRAPFKYSQWVHRSGVAFVQVLGNGQGFLFLTNRLMAPGRIGSALKHQRPAAAAEAIRMRLEQFCSNKEALLRFYDNELAQLDHALEEPPPLSI